MKTKIGILTLGFLLACLFTFAKGTTVISGQSLTEFGQYTVSTSTDAIKIGNETLSTYQLAYSESDSPVLIGVKKTNKCMNFIVRSNNFEIEYICKKHVFGVKKINEDYRTVDPEKVNEMIDNFQYFSQRVITQNPKNEQELLGLIACYFPSLIKEQYRDKI